MTRLSTLFAFFALRDCGLPQRYILAIMGFFAMAIAYTMRVCLSLAITEMVLKPNTTNTSEVSQFEWDQELQGMILSSFYIGYMITHIPGGILAERFGSKYTLCLGILFSAIFTLITPVVVENCGAKGFIILRILMGLVQGTLFPALTMLLASWVPQTERAKIGTFVLGGGQIGTIAGNFFTGLLLHNYNWHAVFYFFGGITIIWFILFVYLCHSSPDQHPFITESEKDYLRKELGQLKRSDNLPPTPWKAILTSVPVMAALSAQIGHDWGFYIIVTDLPKYLSDVLHVSVQNNGFYSSLPFFFMWITSLLSSVGCDYLIAKNYVSVTNARKAFTAVAAIIPSIILLGASYAGNDQILVVILFTLTMGFMGLWYPGMKVNPLDLSPNYAGTLMAVINGISSLTGIAAPYVVGVLTPNLAVEEWRSVFWITFAVFIITTVFYTFWASGEVQPWNHSNNDENDVEAVKNNKTDKSAEVPVAGERALKQ